MTKFAYQHAMMIVKDLIQPGMPTLGDWFGWNQPEEDSVVKLGSIYGSPRPFTLREVLEGTDLGYEQASRLLREHKFDLDEEIRCRCLLTVEEVFVPFAALDDLDKALFRLKVMVVNTYTDAHNWACEWGDAIAEMYYRQAKELEWEMYEPDYRPRAESDLVKDLLFYGVEIPVDVHEDSDFSPLRGSQDAMDYAYEHLPFQFQYNFQRRETAEVLGWILDWLVREYEAGHLAIDWDLAPTEEDNNA